MAFLRDDRGQPGHSFASLALGSTPERILDCAEQICVWLGTPVLGADAFSVVCDASESELEDCFEAMELDEYFILVEAVFMIRPEAPVSFLTLRSCPQISGHGVRAIMSNICGNLMERLANNHFHQTYDVLVLVDRFDAKAEVIAEHGVTLYVDDQPEMLKNVPDGVSVMLFRNEGNFDFADQRWMLSKGDGYQSPEIEQILNRFQLGDD